MLCFGYDCAGGAYGRLWGTIQLRRVARCCIQRGWARRLELPGSRARSIPAPLLAHPAELVPLGTLINSLTIATSLSVLHVCRDRIEASGAFRVTDWAAGRG